MFGGKGSGSDPEVTTFESSTAIFAVSLYISGSSEISSGNVRSEIGTNDIVAAVTIANLLTSPGWKVFWRLPEWMTL